MEEKTDLKNITQVGTSSFALKANLARLKTKVDKLNIDKLVPVPVDLSKFSDAVKNDVVKKAVYDKLDPKVNNIVCIKITTFFKWRLSIVPWSFSS